MCDKVLSFAWDQLFPLARDHLHLLPLLQEAANMIRGVRKEFEELKGELKRVEKKISDQDRMEDRMAQAEENNTSHGNRAKITKLIEAFFLLQDLIDEYMMMCEEEQQPRDNPGCAAGATDLLKIAFLRLQITYNIQNINSTINGMNDTRGRDDASQVEGGTNSSATNQNTTMHRRDAALYIRDTDVVGFDAPKKKLIDWLIRGRVELTVVSVVAMGGQGKTTIAKKVFDSTEVTKHFGYCVWITVSESYTIEVLLREMLTSIYKQEGCGPPQEMDLQSLRSKVSNCLQQKRYVIVFDDVWNPQFWVDIEFVVFDEKNDKGNRILITTRNMVVAKSCKSFSVVKEHVLQPLTPEKSLELFNKRAFPELNGCCPNNLIDMASQIVKKCNGLPLAIVVIADLLSTKDGSIIEWHNFNENLSLDLMEDCQITKILGFSFHDLPYNLKPCLLYFGLYPEDYILDSKSLIRQWIAEGFVTKEKESPKTMEEVAKGYLTELINRSLVQISSISVDGRVKSCRVHDLIHQMILQKIEDLRFCKIISENGQSSLSEIIRRLSVTTESIDLLVSIKSSHVRSLFLLTHRTLHDSFFSLIPTTYKLLKVLTFCTSKLYGNLRYYTRSMLFFSPTKELPKNFGNLIHLKFLSFRGLRMQYLPESIGMLQNLETLDLKGTRLRELPKETSKLRKLQHLLTDRLTSWSLLEDGIGGMTSLQTALQVNLYGTDDELKMIKELGKLKQLRHLVLSRLPNNHNTSLSSSINEMQHLEKLKIIKEGWPEAIDLHLNSPSSSMLQRITIIGKLQKLPEWIPKLKLLVKLKLKHSWLTDDPMKSLKDMQNLLSLSITNYAYIGKILHFPEGGFQNLKELYLEQLPKLRSIIIDKGALHSLKKLCLGDVIKPTGIEHLNMLEVKVGSFSWVYFRE